MEVRLILSFLLSSPCTTPPAPTLMFSSDLLAWRCTPSLPRTQGRPPSVFLLALGMMAAPALLPLPAGLLHRLLEGEGTPNSLS